MASPVKEVHVARHEIRVAFVHRVKRSHLRRQVVRKKTVCWDGEVVKDDQNRHRVSLR